MKYTKLGKSDLTVSRICMGCMGFGNAATGQHSWTVDETQTRDIIRHGLDRGINFYDTAIAYQNGTSEQYVGRALRDFAKRDSVVVATKFTPRTQEEIDAGVSGQKHIESCLNQSLKNLGMMTVYWGGDIPLYSHKLTQEGAGGETVTFAVPADAVGKVSTSMMIAFELEMKDLDCTPRQLNMPWAYVAEDSTLYLPQGQRSSQGLDILPVPFQKNKLLSDFVMVLPDYPEKAELVLAGRVMNMLGQGSVPYGSMRVLGASDFDSTMYDHNLLVVGTGENNALLPKINDSLFFQFTDDFSAVASNDKLILDNNYAATVGTLQIIESPFAQGRSALVASAAGPEGLQSLTNLVSEEKNRWSLAREAVLADGRGTAASYQFTSLLPAEADEKPTFTQIVAENQEPMLMMLIGLGCMFLVLLTVVIVLIRIRANKRDEE